MSEIHLERYEKIGLPLSGVVVVALLFILYLNGNTETPQVPHLVCVTPLVRTARFEEKPFYSEWTLLQVCSGCLDFACFGFSEPVYTLFFRGGFGWEFINVLGVLVTFLEVLYRVG